MPCNHDPTSGRNLVLALASLFAGGALSTALAQPPELTHKDGLLSLPNVRVEMAAVPNVTAGSKAPGSAGMRAYRDEKTGKLRDATPEELLVEAEETPRANDSAGATVVVLPNGRARAVLDDSFMSNALVHRDSDGRPHMQCLVGDFHASALLRASRGISTKETHHDH